MSQLTAAVLGRALADYPALAEMAPGCSVAVNVSARNLLGRGWSVTCSGCWRSTRCPPTGSPSR